MTEPKDPISHKPPIHTPASQPGLPKDMPKYEKMYAKPMTFLGMHFNAKEAAQLWNVIIQQVSSQIRKEQAKALKALRKLKKSSTGEGSDE